MCRPLRNFDSHGTYHVIARGNNKMKLFKDLEDFYYYKNLLLWTKKQQPILIYHYVLMPNHIHMTVNMNGVNLSEFMKITQQSFAKYFAAKNLFVGHVWQDRFKSLVIETDEYLIACGKYIEMNPVRAGLAVDPKDWTWSSYKYYAFGEKDPLVDEDPLVRLVGYSNKQNQKSYRKEFKEPI